MIKYIDPKYKEGIFTIGIEDLETINKNKFLKIIISYNCIFISKRTV